MFGALFVAMWRGWLVPGSRAEKEITRLTATWERRLADLTTQWDDRLREAHDREESWRAAYSVQTEISRTSTAQTAELMQSFSVLEHFIRATPSAIATLQRLHSVPPPEKTEGTA
jgi:hypothetical protein